MRPRHVLAPSGASEIFDRAVRERALAVLTTQGNGTWQTFKSRFLERDAKGRFFVLDYQSFDDDTPLPAVAPGQYVGVSFRQKGRKLLFATVIEAKGHFVVDNRTSVPAVRYRWPDNLTEMQRRAYFRTLVPADTTLLARLWAGGVAARDSARAVPLRVTTGNLADLSCGGTLVHLHEANLPDWADEEILGLELQLPDGRPPIVLDGRYRGTRAGESGTLDAAVQFVGLEMTPDGRAALQRLANSLQRLNRMSLAAGRRRPGTKFEL